MKTIREMWNEQADELNQFYELGKDEVEEFANKIIRQISIEIYKELITITEQDGK
jgi:hypothetical protein